MVGKYFQDILIAHPKNVYLPLFNKTQVSRDSQSEFMTVVMVLMLFLLVSMNISEILLL